MTTLDHSNKFGYSIGRNNNLTIPHRIRTDVFFVKGTITGTPDESTSIIRLGRYFKLDEAIVARLGSRKLVYGTDWELVRLKPNGEYESLTMNQALCVEPIEGSVASHITDTKGNKFSPFNSIRIIKNNSSLFWATGVYKIDITYTSKIEERMGDADGMLYSLVKDLCVNPYYKNDETYGKTSDPNYFNLDPNRTPVNAKVDSVLVGKTYTNSTGTEVTIAADDTFGDHPDFSWEKVDVNNGLGRYPKPFKLIYPNVVPMLSNVEARHQGFIDTETGVVIKPFVEIDTEYERNYTPSTMSETEVEAQSASWGWTASDVNAIYGDKSVLNDSTTSDTGILYTVKTVEEQSYGNETISKIVYVRNDDETLSANGITKALSSSEYNAIVDPAATDSALRSVAEKLYSVVSDKEPTEQELHEHFVRNLEFVRDRFVVEALPGADILAKNDENYQSWRIRFVWNANTSKLQVNIATKYQLLDDGTITAGERNQGYVSRLTRSPGELADIYEAPNFDGYTDIPEINPLTGGYAKTEISTNPRVSGYLVEEHLVENADQSEIIYDLDNFNIRGSYSVRFDGRSWIDDGTGNPLQSLKLREEDGSVSETISRNTVVFYPALNKPTNSAVAKTVSAQTVLDNPSQGLVAGDVITEQRLTINPSFIGATPQNRWDNSKWVERYSEIIRSKLATSVFLKTDVVTSKVTQEHKFYITGNTSDRYNGLEPNSGVNSLSKWLKGSFVHQGLARGWIETVSISDLKIIANTPSGMDFNVKVVYSPNEELKFSNIDPLNNYSQHNISMHKVDSVIGTVETIESVALDTLTPFVFENGSQTSVDGYFQLMSVTVGSETVNQVKITEKGIMAVNGYKKVVVRDASDNTKVSEPFFISTSDMSDALYGVRTASQTLEALDDGTNLTSWGNTDGSYTITFDLTDTNQQIPVSGFSDWTQMATAFVSAGCEIIDADTNVVLANSSNPTGTDTGPVDSKVVDFLARNVNEYEVELSEHLIEYVTVEDETNNIALFNEHMSNYFEKFDYVDSVVQQEIIKLYSQELSLLKVVDVVRSYDDYMFEITPDQESLAESIDARKLSMTKKKSDFYNRAGRTYTDVAGSYPISYRLTVSGYGVLFHMWDQTTLDEDTDYAWFVAQRHVDNDDATPYLTHKSPLHCVYSTYKRPFTTDDTPVYYDSSDVLTRERIGTLYDAAGNEVQKEQEIVIPFQITEENMTNKLILPKDESISVWQQDFVKETMSVIIENRQIEHDMNAQVHHYQENSLAEDGVTRMDGRVKRVEWSVDKNVGVDDYTGQTTTSSSNDRFIYDATTHTVVLKNMPVIGSKIYVRYKSTPTNAIANQYKLVKLEDPEMPEYNVNKTKAIYRFVVRETDVLKPWDVHKSATMTEIDSAPIINPMEQLSVTPDRRFVFTVPNGLTTQRFYYPSSELDLIATSSAEVTAQGSLVDITKYGEEQNRTYEGMMSTLPDGNGMRLFVLVKDGPIKSEWSDSTTYTESTSQ